MRMLLGLLVAAGVVTAGQVSVPTLYQNEQGQWLDVEIPEDPGTYQRHGTFFVDEVTIELPEPDPDPEPDPVPDPAGTIIVDNESAGFEWTGTAGRCSQPGGYEGTHCSAADKGDRAFFGAGNPAGDYLVCARWVGNWQAFSTSFYFGSEVAVVDQSDPDLANRWIELGAAALPANAKPMGRPNVYGNGTFDAVALVPASGECPVEPNDPPVPEPDPDPDPQPDPEPPVGDLTDPANDAEMIAAVRASIPAQHATEARFVKIPGSEIDVLVTCAEFPDFGQHIGCQKSYNAFIDWTGGAWNWVDWEMAQPAGGGHSDYGGNEVYLAEMKLTDAGLLGIDWSRPIDPQPLSDTECGAPVEGPVASHTYASPVFVEANGEYFHITTGGWPATTACNDRGQNKLPGQGLWVHDNAAWSNVSAIKMAYPRAAYHRNLNKIYVRQQTNGGDSFTVDAGDNYALTLHDSSGWFSGAGHFDSAFDQQRNIEYWYHNLTGIKGLHRPVDGSPAALVFESVDDELVVPSLSVEHSTGDLIVVGTAGYVLHLDASTGVATDISAPDGIISPTATGKNIYGKFDMIEKIPCVGIGTADPRYGVFLMVLPESVCDLNGDLVVVDDPAPDPVPDPQPPVVTDSEFLESCAEPGVVFCDPLSTHGPYAKDSAGELIVLTNDDGTQGVPGHSWWRNWRGVQQWGANTAGYDPELDALKLVMTDTRGSSGLFTTNFSKDLQTQFAEGDTFRVQFQFRYNCEYIYVDCDPDSPSFKTDRRPIVNDSNQMQGAKIAIVGEGDAVPGESANACVKIQIVAHSGTGHSLEGFHNCGKYLGFDVKTGKSIGGSKQLDHQAGGDHSCLRFPDDSTRTFADWSDGGTGPNCALLESDEWMTFAMEVRIGEGQWTIDHPAPEASRVKFLLAHEGEPLREVINLPWRLAGPDARYWGYGKVWLQMHSTKAQNGVGRPDAVAHYRNLVVTDLSAQG